jgi:hypothetical protein
MLFGKKVKRSRKVVRKTKDVVMGFGAMDGDVYPATIKKAYIHTSSKGANFFKLELKLDSGATLRVSECFQSGDEKGNSIFYTDKDGNDQDLPGYAMLNDLLVCAMGEEIIFQDEDDKDIAGDIFDLLEDDLIEEKQVLLYDFTQKEEVPTTVPVITPLVNAKINIGVVKEIIDVGTKDSTGNFIYKEGKMVPSGTSKEVNRVHYYFNDENCTANEFILDSEGTFITEWLKSFGDKVIDRTVNKIGLTSGGGSSSKASSTKLDPKDVFNT